MKKEVDDFISRCLEFQKVKAEHIHPASLLQPLSIPEWKWKVVKIEFIINLLRTTKKNDSIMVVVDKLAKDSHFILVNLTHKETKIAKIYRREISRLYGVPKEIYSNRDPKFISNFGNGLFKVFGTNMKFSITYHQESYGKIKRFNQVIEDMLMMYVMDKQLKRDDYIHLVDFYYSNGYLESLNMIPFQKLYGRK
jgi:hypothetical protein